MRTNLSLLAATAALALATMSLAPAARADAPAAPEVQIEEAQGQAAVLAGDKPAAREKALQDALRQAVQQAVGTQVTSTTEVQEFQTKMDQVLTRSAGYVRKYSVVKEGMDGDVVQVTVRAEVSLGALDKDLEAMGLLLARKGMPRTMLLIAEQNIGMAAPHASWMTHESTVVAADLRIGENTVLDELRKAGFAQLIDPEIAETQAAQVGGITTSLNAAQARKLGSLTHAEVIIIGQVIAISRGEIHSDWAPPGFHSCSATLSARAVNTDNGEILAASEITQPAAQIDDLTCGKDAIKKAAKLFSADITQKIAAHWSSEVSGGSQVHVTVKNVQSLKQAGEFKAGLTNFMRGVKAVASRGYSEGAAEYDVTLVGSTEELAQEIEAKKVGKFSVKVKGVTANTIVVELGKE